MEETRKTVVMRNGDIFADIFDSPETIAQARRDGYSLVEAEDIKKSGLSIDELSKKELIELAKEKGVYEKGMERLNKPDIIDRLKTAEPEEPDTPARAELVQTALAKGFEEAALVGLSDDEIAELLAE